jgi:Na+/proline symporter
MCQSRLGLCWKCAQKNELLFALSTGILFFAVSFLNALPEATLPTWLEVYIALRGAIALTIVTYVFNKTASNRAEKQKEGLTKPESNLIKKEG